jgi:predicted anti-sigma-YlaC factor YlaD
MNTHVTIEQLERYRDKNLTAEELIPVDEHLSVCQLCHQRFRDIFINHDNMFPMQVDLDTTDSEDDEHLEFDEHIVNYVENTLDDVDREIVKSHLEYCVTCTAEVNSLINFREQLTKERTTIPIHEKSTQRIWGRLVQSWMWQPSKWTPAYALGLASLVIGVTLIAIVTFRSGKQQTNISNNQPSQTIDPVVSTTNPQVDPNKEIASQTPTDPGKNIAKGEGSAEYGLDMLPANLQEDVKDVLTAKAIRKPQILSKLSEESITRLGGAESTVTSFDLLTPRKTVIRSQRPTFKWRPLEGTTSYSIHIYDENYKEVAKAESLSNNQWQIPIALKRGMVYSWQVIASKDGKEIVSPASTDPEAKFKVLDQSKHNDLTKVESNLGKSSLILGTIYARMGLVEEAKQELNKVKKNNPQSTLANKLIQQIKNW